MKKIFFYATIISGAAAAYLMFRRGETLGTIASKVTTNPVGSLTSELKAAL